MQGLPQRLGKYPNSRAPCALLSRTNLVLQCLLSTEGCKGHLLPSRKDWKGQEQNWERRCTQERGR